MEFNWIRGNACAGWRIELQKSVVTCETWLNHAFPHLSTQQQRAFLDDDMYAALKQKHAAARANNRHARDLQQYFSSPELVKFVVAQVLKVVEVHQVVWLEPSCGDGRFLTTLVRAGAQDVVGYEIDDKLQHVAAQRVARAVADVATRSGPLPRASEIPIHAQVYQGDFLVSRSCVPAHKCVVALGNPPYGARRDDGSDLVHRFLEHAANEWRARVIVFIVPTRCARPAFLETTFALLRGGSQSAPATVSSWKLVAESSLGDYHFELRTGDTLKRVRQPSVLQLFVRDTQRVEPPAG
ncbi:hypothetical protein PsorP6_013461 [Peronosclerospora sorghi]|uniref:Uncharacterized protein n=1 Tax=Peronosclerospora sorghi TaxID=230839 RepID=A0ACC0VIG6_9STRA|nr:hypothetical protein PsorP6_013461 [Peronosclerospora sorghi]